MQPAHEAILAAIEASRHYAFLSPALVRRIIREEYPRYKRDKERVKAVKNRLHQHFGAFVGDRSHAQASALLDAAVPGDAPALQAAAAQVLGLHASSMERLAHMDAFYAFAFAHAPKAHSLSIVDIGCGFHPFAIPWMPVSIAAYHAVDIDTRTESLLNRFFAAMGLPPAARTADVLCEPFAAPVDVALLLKVLPVMEAQQRGSAQRILDSLTARLVVVSYPVKSLGGRAKGMLASYTAAFEALNPGGRRVAAKTVIGDELVYVLETLA